MKITNGKILVFLGTIHLLFAVTPFAFGKQFSFFASKMFFKISEGILEFPLFKGEMNYENFAAFWFFYAGLLLIPLGILVNYIEGLGKKIPASFMYTYLIVVIVGVYMIPFSGMTVFMLPHAIYMMITRRKQTKQAADKITITNA